MRRELFKYEINWYMKLLTCNDLRKAAEEFFE